MKPYYTDERVTLHHGDCLEVLRSLPDASVDAVVTDPPYGLEFMGKSWDAPWQKGDDVNADAGIGAYDLADGYTRLPKPSYTGSTNPKCLSCGGTQRGRKDGTAARKVCVCDSPRFPNVRAVEMRAFQQWCIEWTAECLRVLKPGGHMLAFGGTRTWHRLACAVEDAGFEIRDSIAWLYGCLTDDVEVLTADGWRKGIDITEGDVVAQWNPEDARITLAPVERTYRAPWDGPLISFRNSDTDQALTPNHRVWHRRHIHRGENGRTWREWGPYEVADADSLSRKSPVRLPLAGHHDGPGIGGEDYAALLGWVWTEGGFDNTGTGVRIFQSSANADHCTEIAALLDRLTQHKRYDYQREWKGRAYTASTWFWTGELAARVRTDLPGKHPTYDLLLRMTAAEKEAFYDATIKGDGHVTARGVATLEQKDADDRAWFVTLLALIGKRGHDYARKARDGGGVSVSQRADTTLSPAALAHSTEDYTGDVWCIGVPTGAFVARRNGKVFITGNSGFPKSLDVSKAIDKAAGAEREVVGRTVTPFRVDNAATRGTSLQGSVNGDFSKQTEDGYRYTEHTAPATPDAERWQGWGSAMKPAFEPVVVARKPLIGTIAQNVLQHGTGALNIDACRVEGEPWKAHSATGLGKVKFFTEGETPVIDKEPHAAGRWPTNVVLDDSQAAELDRQSGELSSGANPTQRGSDKFRDAYGDFKGQEECTPARGADTGGASRFFPTFRYEAKAPSSERPKVDGIAHPTVKPLELLRWLVRLVAPPGGTVLEPFAGSGTTVEAALIEGFHCIAIEREADYLPLITQRIHRRRDPVAAIRQTGDDLGLFDLEPPA